MRDLPTEMLKSYEICRELQKKIMFWIDLFQKNQSQFTCDLVYKVCTLIKCSFDIDIMN